MASQVLLGRVNRVTRAEAEDAGFDARQRLAAVPAHMRAEAVAGVEEIRHAFEPFRVRPDGIAEVRRPCVIATPQRLDAGAKYYLVVPPLHSAPQRLPKLLELLAGAGMPAMVSTGIEPIRIREDFRYLLFDIAKRYARLARPGMVTEGLYSSLTRLEPDPFAAAAERLYTDAARSYTDNAFRLRITVATARPLEDRLASAIAELFDIGAQTDEPVLFGASPMVERPLSPSDQELLLNTVAFLGVPSWGGHPAVPKSLRLLCELANDDLVAAAAWLPATATGSLPGLMTVEPSADERTPTGAHSRNSAAGAHSRSRVAGGTNP